MVLLLGYSICWNTHSNSRYAPAQEVTQKNQRFEVSRGSQWAMNRIPMEAKAPKYETCVSIKTYLHMMTQKMYGRARFGPEKRNLISFLRDS